jgi:hypothetical protein
MEPVRCSTFQVMKASELNPPCMIEIETLHVLHWQVKGAHLDSKKKHTHMQSHGRPCPCPVSLQCVCVCVCV